MFIISSRIVSTDGTAEASELEFLKKKTWSAGKNLWDMLQSVPSLGRPRPVSPAIVAPGAFRPLGDWANGISSHVIKDSRKFTARCFYGAFWWSTTGQQHLWNGEFLGKWKLFAVFSPMILTLMCKASKQIRKWNPAWLQVAWWHWRGRKRWNKGSKPSWANGAKNTTFVLSS